jgi:EmrB/QacA subfamily drug resistance transporter
MLTESRGRWLALMGMSLASFLGCIDFTIVNTALPVIQASLQASVTQLQWIVNIFFITMTAFMVVLGKLADMHGRRLYIYWGMILFGISSLGAGLSPTIGYLIFFRFLQSIAVSILYCVPIAIIHSIFPANLYGRATGFVIGMNGFGMAVGPVIGGFILNYLSWRYIFFVNLPLIVLSFLFCLPNLPETKSSEENEKIDWLGFILLVITLPIFVLAIVQGETWHWLSPIIIGLFILAIIGLVWFYFHEQACPFPIIEFHLFLNRVYIIGVAANFALAFFYVVDFFFMPLYLHYVRGQSSYEIGLTLLISTAMVAALSPLIGRLVDKFGAKKILIIGYSFFIASAILQAQFNAITSIYLVLFAYILFGIGWACILSPSIVAAISSVPKNVTGVAMGTLGTLHNFGGAIGLALAVVIYRILATHLLTQQALIAHFSLGEWVNNAILDIGHTAQIIVQHTNLALPNAQIIFTEIFLRGYTGALWLLVASSVSILILIMVGLKKETTSHG